MAQTDRWAAWLAQLRTSGEPAQRARGFELGVVTTRSVLIYVAGKQAAFAEFFRVLRPGGRISFFEPINRFTDTNADVSMGYDLSRVADLGRKVRAIGVARSAHAFLVGAKP
jgi:SAM-dependent methyltransferase